MLSLYLILVLLFHAQASVTLSNVGVSAFVPQVNIETSLSFSFSSSPVIQSGWKVRMDWPSQVTQLSTSPSCTTFFDTQNTVQCDYTDGNNYAETTVTTNVDFGVVTISNFRTPPSTKPTSAFSLTVTDSGGSVQATYSNQFFTLTVSSPNVFAASSMLATASPSKVGETGPVELTLTPTTTLPAAAQIVVEMPLWNPTANSPSSMISSSTTCSGVQNTGSLLGCSVTSNTLTISNVVDSDTSSEIKISITNVLYPLTTGPRSGIKLTSKTSDGLYQIDENPDLSLTGVDTAATLLLVGSGLSVANSGTVSETGSATFRFRVPVPIAQNCKFNIKFPVQMAVESASTTVNVNYISFPRQQTGLYSAPKSSGSARDIYLNYVCPDNYLQANQLALFTINDVANPSSTKTTDSFQIYILDESDNKIAELTSGITWQAASGTIAGLAFNLNPSIVRSLSTATVSFTPTHSIPSTGKLLIEFPTDVAPTAVDTAGCSLSATTEVRSDATCEIIGQFLHITNPFLGDSAGVFIEFSIATIQAPDSTKPIGAMVVSTYELASDSQTLIDTNSASSLFTATTGTMTQAFAGPESTADKLTYEIVTYLFSMKPQNAIPVGGYIQVTLPSDDSLMAVLNSNINVCSGVSGFVSAIDCEVDSTSSFRIINGFVTGEFITDGTADLSFRMNGMRNPRSFLQTHSFTFTSFDSQDFQIDSKNTAITTKMNIASPLPQVQFATSSVQNAASATYTFTLTAKSPLLASDVLKITCPSEVSKPPNPTPCSVGGVAISGGCSVIGSLITVPSLLVIGEGGTFAVAIQGFTNPSTTRPSSTFTLVLEDNQGNRINQFDGPLIMQTSIPQEITSASLVQSVTTTFTASDYTFEFETLSQLGTTNVLQILFPSTLTLPESVGCLGNQNIVLTDSNCVKSGSNIVNVENGFQGVVATRQTVKFTLLGIINSKLAADTDTITITIKDADGYQLDKVQSGLRAIANCNYPCFSCTDRQSAPSECTACNPDWTQHFLKQTECVSECGQQWREVSSTLCQACNERCLECETHIDVCSKCGLPAFPVWVNNNCITQCDNSFFSKTDPTYGNICAPCELPCDTCSSQTQCLTCSQDAANSQKLFQSPECVASCTPQTYVEIGLNCEPCADVCNTCSNSPDSCESCNPGWLFYNNYCYDGVCPEGSYADASNQNCLSCTDDCTACSGSSSFCTKCTGTLNLENNQCVSECPAQKYPLDNVCVPCTGDCVECTSETYCTLCTGSLLAYKGTCVGSCPSGNTVQSGSECIDCDSSCALCSTTPTNCISCLGTQVLYNGSCYAECPAGSTLSSDGLSCETCATQCEECSTSSSYCTKCAGGLFAHLGECVSSCPATSSTNIPLVGSEGQCQECNANCLTCQTTPNTCSSCEVGWVLQSDLTCFNQAGCVNGEEFINGECVIIGHCPSNYAKNGFGTCISLAEQTLAWFPFMFCALIAFIVALISKCSYRESFLISNFLMLMSGLELMIYLVLMIQGFLWGSAAIGALVLLAFLFLIAANLIWSLLCYRKQIVFDQGFQIWRRLKKRADQTIIVISAVISFKISRLYYSRFFGSDLFYASFDNPRAFARPFNHVSWANMVTSMLLTIIASIIGFAQVAWGFQLLITCIQAFIIQILIIVLTLIESRTALIYTAKPGDYGEIRIPKSDISEGESRLLLLNVDPNIKREYMKDIIKVVRIGRGEAYADFFEQAGKQKLRKNKSLPDIPNVEKAPDQKSFSYPTTPKNNERIAQLPNIICWGATVPDELLPDNVIAEAKPPDPLKTELEMVNNATQTNKSTVRKMKEQRRYFETDNFIFSDQISEIEISDDELAIVMEESELDEREDLALYIDPTTGELRKKTDNDSIDSREIGPAQARISAPKESKYREDQIPQDLEASASLPKALAEGMFAELYDQFSETEEFGEKLNGVGNLAVVKKEEQDPKTMLMPRDQQAIRKQKELLRRFNFNTGRIRGMFDKDPQGNIVVMKNPEGELIDKQGNRVNKKGYLVDGEGNVIDRRGKIVFKASQLDSDDEIPGFYTVDELEEYDTQAEGEDLEEYQVEKELKAIKSVGQQSANSSVNEAMDLSPEGFNEMNQGKVRPPSSLHKMSTQDQNQEEENISNPEMISSGGDVITEPKNKKHLKRKKKKSKIPLTEADIMLAKAYGGKPKKAKLLSKVASQKSSALPLSLTTSNSRSVRGFQFPSMKRVENDDTQSKLFSLVNSISGLGEDGASNGRNSKRAKNMSRVASADQRKGRPLVDIGEESVRSRQILQERVQEIKKDPQRDASILDDGYYGGLIRGTTTDSDWDILVAGKRAPTTNKKKSGQKSHGRKPSRLDQVKANLDLLLNSSEGDDNLSRSGSMRSFYSGVSKHTRGEPKRLKGLEAIYLQRLERRGKKGNTSSVPSGLMAMSQSGSQILQTSATASRRKIMVPKFRNMQDRFEYDLEQAYNEDQPSQAMLNEADRKFFPDMLKSLEVRSPGLFAGHGHYYEDKAKFSSRGKEEDHWAVRKSPPSNKTLL